MQATFCVELGQDDDRLEIPWASPDDAANRYYDLKGQPELLPELVEAHRHPPLRRFLELVNSAESLFATAKCDTWTTTEFSTLERTAFPAARTKFASYVDLVFASHRFNFHRHHYQQLARRLEQQLASARARARAELCLRHCFYREHSAWGFYLTIFLYGYGTDPVEAEQQWAAGLAALAGALRRLSGILQQILARARGASGSSTPTLRRN